VTTVFAVRFVEKQKRRMPMFPPLFRMATLAIRLIEAVAEEDMTAESQKRSLQAGPEQLVYAGILEKGMLLGLLLLIITYLIYLSGIIKPYVPLAEVSRYWSMNVHDYLHTAHIKPGWAWLSMIGYSDFLNFIPIAMLAGVTIICFLAVVPVLLKENDKLYAGLALVEALILTVAASGILGSGGH
jgi:hypothetical protein